MKINKKKVVSILLISISIILLGANTYAHSGRTDSSGGHRDKKNKSGLGGYHYHCGGYPAHLHENGVCPYSSNKKTTSSSSSSSSNTKKQTSSSVSATGIEINETIQEMQVGENKTLTATIKPSNVTNKNITWKSSDENIVAVSSNGKIEAKKSGAVEIIASTSNGKTSTIRINVKEQPKKEEASVVQVVAPIVNDEKIKNTSADINTNSTDDSTVAGTILALGILGGGGYLGYKKYGKSKNNFK